MLRRFLAPCALFAGALSLISATAASCATVEFTDSNQLSLTGRDVLSAVNFYYDAGDNIQVTSPIQGVVFDNLNVVTSTVAGALTLTKPNILPSDSRTQTGAGITDSGADTTPAQQLARNISYLSNGQSALLDYDFGIGNANRIVKVQIIGGDAGWTGTMEVRKGVTVLGTVTGDNDMATADLINFTTTTDATGSLLLTAIMTATNFYGLAGAVVTAAFPPPPPPVPEPATFALVGLSALGLAYKLRRRRRD